MPATELDADGVDQGGAIPTSLIIKDFESLLGNNRTPKVSELRMGMLASYGMGGTQRADAGNYICQRLSAQTLARMAFADSEAMYRDPPTCAVKIRPAGMPVEGGGFVAGAGLYANQDMKAGDIITEFEINGHITAITDSENMQLYVDPRVGASPDLLPEQLAAESMSVRIGTHSTAYFMPLALRSNPHKLMAFANDSMPYPPAAVPNRADVLHKYAEHGGAGANSTCQGVYGFVVHLVASKDIRAGEEILYHWGARHWDELYRLREKGMRLRLHAIQEGAAQPEPCDEVSTAVVGAPE